MHERPSQTLQGTAQPDTEVIVPIPPVIPQEEQPTKLVKTTTDHEVPLMPLRHTLTSMERRQLYTWYSIVHGHQPSVGILVDLLHGSTSPSIIQLNLEDIWKEGLMDKFQSFIHTAPNTGSTRFSNFAEAQALASNLVKRYSTPKNGIEPTNFQMIQANPQTISNLLDLSTNIYQTIKEIMDEGWTLPVNTYCKNCKKQFDCIILMHCLGGCYSPGSHDILSQNLCHVTYPQPLPNWVTHGYCAKFAKVVSNNIKGDQNRLCKVFREIDKEFGKYMKNHVLEYGVRLSMLMLHEDYICV